MVVCSSLVGHRGHFAVKFILFFLSEFMGGFNAEHYVFFYLTVEVRSYEKILVNVLI